MPWWLIGEIRLEKHLKSGTGRGLTIVIILRNSIKVSKLCSKELRFQKALKVVERYWEAGPGLIYISYVSIGHDCLGECRNRALQCSIYLKSHKIKNYRCEVT